MIEVAIKTINHCELCVKVTVKTLEKHHYLHFGTVIIDFEKTYTLHI